MGTVEFYKYMKGQAMDRGSLYHGSVTDREKLIDFLEMNDWFGLKNAANPEKRVLKGREKLLVPEDTAQLLSGHLNLWLDGYRKSNREKVSLLIDFGKERFPQTMEFYQEFVGEQRCETDISSWRLLDFLLFYLPREICEMNAEEMELLAGKLDGEATRSVSELFARFNRWTQVKTGNSGWGYKYEYRKKRQDLGAYTVEGFSVMAYCVFNDEHWEKENLLQKACESAPFANLWAFIAMHFVCALRSTDIVRLPMPDIGEEPVVFRERLLNREIPRPERFSRELQLRVSYSPKHPNKTARYSHIPELKIFIPSSLERPLGIILAVAASHRGDVKPGEPFIRADRNRTRTCQFFGQAFIGACQGKGFASIRANKSYLQGLEKTAATGDGHAKGYMIAALARSHKGGIGKLPDVTDIYLKDATFSGYTPEFIAREMFERGVFGFVPHLLLEVYAGSDYTSLNVSTQTKLIKEIGIRPSGVEELVRLNDRALLKAREVVAEMLSPGTDVACILQQIASGEAAGKQTGSLCARIAGGFPCAYPVRQGCTGCRYEIYTKTVLHHLASEYFRMRKLAGMEDGWRYQRIIRDLILPVTGEYLACIKESDWDPDMEFMSSILERGLKGYDYSGEQTGRGGLQQVPGC